MVIYIVKSSYKSRSTANLYEFAAEDLGSFDKKSDKSKQDLAANSMDDNFSYSMEFPTNAYVHNHNGEAYDIVD
ncbi:hypothetical protein [Sporomusa acidovorans]|uniref:Uncharacterized protein n=1 Tax=Sporomusa acidovorans (strain ATCC 49682 / DSM 3132 / Mol) TaxID=1123286 RepID=A0ABZ3J3I9_SPOA4|nr:hypothetical protein [Sporomusa acidovorans]OZC20175.1 hypothetical protein SPACI_25730 [Sporomusa acidovorans DSM 3132]SDD42978.1 hypothetical protein SAMN04488499_1001215 [Sporomusa acidovorans]